MTRIVLTTAMLIMTTGTIAIAGCKNHSQQVMSCAEGATWDSATQTCVPQTSS